MAREQSGVCRIGREHEFPAGEIKNILDQDTVDLIDLVEVNTLCHCLHIYLSRQAFTLKPVHTQSKTASRS
jgi:hypothetical protein